MTIDDDNATADARENDITTASSVLDSSRIKAFLYKQEPNLAKIKHPRLQLISTTSELFLKSIVDASKEEALEKRKHSKEPGENVAKRSSKRKRGNAVATEIHSSNAKTVVNPPLISLDILQQAILENPSMNFLSESLTDIRDNSFGSLHSLCPYLNSKTTKTHRVPGKEANDVSDAVEDSIGTGRTDSKTRKPPLSIQEKLGLDASKPSMSSIARTSITAGIASASDEISVKNNNRNLARNSTQIQMDEDDYD
jgi:hypothetical protein